jgi:hypothetical protein
LASLPLLLSLPLAEYLPSTAIRIPVSDRFSSDEDVPGVQDPPDIAPMVDDLLPTSSSHESCDISTGLRSAFRTLSQQIVVIQQ